MLDEWYLKDVDTWQKAKGEKGIGKALCCLHPLLVRIRTSTPPITVAKPVIVVISPARVRISDPRGLNDSSPSGMTAIEPVLATDPVMSALNQESPAQIKLAHNPATLTASTLRLGDSVPNKEGHRPTHSHKRTRTYLDLLSAGYQCLWSPITSRKIVQGTPNLDLRTKDSCWEDREKTRTSFRQTHVTRGHFIAGSSWSHRSQGPPARQPSMKPSRDTFNGRNWPRRFANENPQPSLAPSTPVPGTYSGQPRGFTERFFPWR